MSPVVRPLELVINRNILQMEYAVRRPIPQRAAELRAQGRSTIPCNIGNPQALGQPPLSDFRQLLGLVEVPGRIARERRAPTGSGRRVNWMPWRPAIGSTSRCWSGPRTTCGSSRAAWAATTVPTLPPTVAVQSIPLVRVSR